MADWYVGQKVVCVDVNAGWYAICSEAGIAIPDVGAVYTIRDITPPVDAAGRPWCYFRLEEIRNPPNPSGREPRFSSPAFRPLVNQSSDISVFTDLLIPLNKREVVRA